MSDAVERRPTYGTGPFGKPLTIDDLPPRNLNHWVVRRKAEVVAAIDSGLLSLEDASERYDLSPEELAEWQRAAARFGIPGLRVTRLQHYRARGSGRPRVPRKRRSGSAGITGRDDEAPPPPVPASGTKRDRHREH